MNVLFLTNDDLTQPLSIGYLSSVLLRDGHCTELTSLRNTARQKKLLTEFKPDILALSLVTGRHTLFLDIVRQIKQECPGITVLAGGPHPTFYPEFIHEEGIDAVCRGEGEIALPALINAFERDRRSLPDTIANWWVKKPDGSVAKHDVGPLIEDLDTLPYPDRDMYDRAYPHNEHATVYAMTSRGCPFKCSYCFNHAYQELYRGKGRSCRRRGVENLLGELAGLKQGYPLQIVVFQDDTFNLDTAWLKKFAAQYPREISLPFHCHLRADLLDGESAALLRAAGCISVKLGLEAADEHIRNNVFNRSMTLEQFENACSLLRGQGIRFATENILAVPGSTLENDLLTYAVNYRIRPDFCFATLLQLYPRTRIAEYAVSKGLVTGEPAEFPGTFYQDASFTLEHKQERGCLRALFALGAGLHIAPNIMRWLIRLKLRKFYELCDRLWKGYCLRFRIYPYRQSAAGFAREALHYLREKCY